MQGVQVWLPRRRAPGALTKASVDHTIETYLARHGWVFRDTPVYGAAANERHWQTMIALFDAKLKHQGRADAR